MSPDKVSAGKQERAMVKDTADLKTTLTLGAELFPFRKKKKIDPPPARNLGHLFVARAIVLGDRGARLPLSL